MQYQICKRCVMDTTDPEISFDEVGICSHCKKFDHIILPQWRQCTKDLLDFQVSQIKQQCCNNPYDVIIGLSGGVDSSYLLHFMKKEYNLRILAVHVDAGWNSNIAVSNIEKLVNKLGVDLHTIVIDWEEMRDLQVAFLKSGVANCDTPQDHAFFGALYSYAVKNKVRYVVNGGNFATESILPIAWGHNAMDSMQIKDIHSRFGSMKLKNFPLINFFQCYFYYPKIKKMKVLRPLNNMIYNKQLAVEVLQREYSWEIYQEKHGESVWTKFFQGYFLPVKFGFDKRRAHYSSMILAGDMGRAEALERLEELPYNKESIHHEMDYILKKLQLSEKEWSEIMATPIRSYRDYKNNEKLYQLMRRYL